MVVRNDHSITEPIIVEDQIRLEIKERIKQYEDNCMSLARLLNQVKTQELYTDWGFSCFEDYVQTDLGFEIRRAYYHIGIWKTFGEDLHIPESRIQEIGWTKAGHLTSLHKAGILNDDNVEDWVERATEVNTKSLIAEIREAKKNASDGPSEVRVVLPPQGPSTVPTINKMTFHLYENQEESVNRAIEVAQQMTGSDKKGHLLDTICLSFLAGEGSSVGTRTETLQWFLAHLEKTFKVKLVSFNNNDNLKKNLADLLDGLT